MSTTTLDRTATEKSTAPAHPKHFLGRHMLMLELSFVLGETASSWIRTPNPVFDGLTPAQALREGRLAEVHEFLQLYAAKLTSEVLYARSR